MMNPVPWLQMTNMISYQGLVRTFLSPTSPAGQNKEDWEFEMVNRLKKDATQFKNRPIKEYLDY